MSRDGPREANVERGVPPSAADIPARTLYGGLGDFANRRIIQRTQIIFRKVKTGPRQAARPRSGSTVLTAFDDFMKSLRGAPSIAIETLRSSGVRGRRSRRRSMLDLAFVALGFVVIGLMAFYAVGLRQL
jgi:hypothetical protein